MQGGEAWVIALVNAAGGEETITFKVYDASSGVTFEKSGASAVITPGLSVGTYADPLLIEMTTTVTQGLSLKAGWNLVSFYVEPEDAAPATVLAAIKDKLEQIKNLTDSYKPLPFPPFLNTLTTMAPGLGYWLKVTENGTWTVGDVSESSSGRDIA